MLGAGLLATAGSARAADHGDVDSSDVNIKTIDGICDVSIIRPGRGSWPGVIMWPDAGGVRPASREVAKRVASEGFTVLLPNPFYRVALAAKALEITGKDRQPLIDSISSSGACERDAATFIVYLLSILPDLRGATLGSIGYCMGGSLAMRVAGSDPRRIRAFASFHGGNNMQKELISRITAPSFIGIAADDDQKMPAYKDTLRAAFVAARNPATIEVFPGTKHGWCVPGDAYNAAQAERATMKMVATFKSLYVNSSDPDPKA